MISLDQMRARESVGQVPGSLLSMFCVTVLITTKFV